jgi:cyclic 2,3-diphosphoglycerate synthetase
VGAHQDHAVATGYLNPYRALLADLVVVTMAEDHVDHASLAAELGMLTRPDVPIVRAVLRPRPLADVRGCRVAFFGTAPESHHARVAAHLRDSCGAEVTSVSGNLSNRPALQRDLARLDADVVIVEVKAAAIDVVAEEAARRGLPVVLAGNDVVPLPGEPDLDAIVERLGVEALDDSVVSV